jgi:hypothetical protein
MPVKSSNSPVFKWPAREAVEQALSHWATELAAERPELLRLGVFGSFADGNWGFGSDLDLVAVISSSAVPFQERRRGWRTEKLPVPADLLVYTMAEWTWLAAQENRFGRLLRNQVRWLLNRDFLGATSANGAFLDKGG